MPYHPCDSVPDGHKEAAAICDSLKGSEHFESYEIYPDHDFFIHEMKQLFWINHERYFDHDSQTPEYMALMA